MVKEEKEWQLVFRFFFEEIGLEGEGGEGVATCFSIFF